MRKTWLGVVVSLCAYAVTGTATWASATFTMLTPMSGVWIDGVSGDGKYAVGAINGRATRWRTDNTVRTDIGTSGIGQVGSQGRFLSFNGSMAVADSYAYDVVGAGPPLVFRLTFPSTKVSVPFMAAGAYMYAAGLSSDGEVLAGWGGTTADENPQRLARWTSAGGTKIVPLPAGIDITVTAKPDMYNTRALSGNGNFIIGNTLDAVTNVGFRYDNNTGISTSLGQMQAGKVPHLTSISNDGSVITGYSSYTFPDLSTGQVGFVWTAAGGFVNLGFLNTKNDSVTPFFLSGDGKTIVGTYNSKNFIWTQKSGMIDLDTYFALRGVDTQGMLGLMPRGISDDGNTIVGMGVLNNDYHGFSVSGLVAVPEPGTLALLNVAAVGMIVRRRRKA